MSATALALVLAATIAPPGGGVLHLQVLLDRAHFSPGEIDGREGSNTRRALCAFQRQRGLAPLGVPTDETWVALGRDEAPALAGYTLAEADVAGPFTQVPADMMEKATLGRLEYSSAVEALAERFHSSPDLLRRLNPGAAFTRPGEALCVPNVHLQAPGTKAARVVVDADGSSVTAFDGEGAIVAYYPASMGSEHDPLPVGEFAIGRVVRDPAFFYDPGLFWDADASHAKVKIPQGPNSPVGVVWIELSREHYGIHGTPEPSKVGKTQSHGCVRLTNWDAEELAFLVSEGTPAVLVREGR
jgi:lipoprotein-anchoring transpeptidase ErfK/SrfK